MIALGLDFIYIMCLQKMFLNSHFQKSISTQEGFSSNLMASSTTLQLGKSANPVSVSFG